MLQRPPIYHPIIMPSVLTGIHPSSSNNNYTKTINRSPANGQRIINSQENRSLSPNKLNATKKPLLVSSPSQPLLPFSNNIPLTANPSPSYKNPHPKSNYISGNLNGHNNNNNYFSNPVKTVSKPLINSNFYENANPGLRYEKNEKTKFCNNHGNKLAEFVTEVDNEEIGYCQKCAINLASKGFEIVRKDHFQCKEQKPNLFQKHKVQPFHNPEYMNRYGYSEIENFMNQIDSIHAAYISQIHKLQTISMHYENQYTITEEFYESLMSVVEQMKCDHLTDLECEAKKHTQEACIREDHLKNDLEELHIIRNDVSQSIGIIINEFDNGDVQMALGAYRQKAFMLKSKIEEESAEFDELIINEKESDIVRRLKLIENYLLDVWNDKIEKKEGVERKPKEFINPELKRNNQDNGYQQTNNSTQERPQRTVKNLFNLGEKVTPQVNGYGGPSSAYRTLFEDDNENPCLDSKENQLREDFPSKPFESENPGGSTADQVSPQFKKI